MKKVQEKILKPVFIITIIFVLTVADFLVLGMQVISYAISAVDVTNSDNVLFAASFLDDDGNKSTYLERNMDDANMKLCLELQVKNEGYFNGEIRIDNANFRLKTDVSNQYINSISENSIVLNQINVDENISLELGIEPIKDSVFELSLINRITNVSVLGTYVTSSKKDIKINDKREVQLVLGSPYVSDTTENGLDLQAQIVTNKVYSVNGENKRLLQMEIVSGLSGNKYPIKSTKILADVFDGVESVVVEKRGTFATNNDNTDVQSNWIKEQNKFEIDVINDSNDGKVHWNQSNSDKVLVTYILNEGSSVVGNNIKVNSHIELYDNKNTVISKDVVASVVEEIDGAVSYDISSQPELYKGNLYYGEDSRIQSKSVIDIRYNNIASVITVNEGNSTYVRGKAQDSANLGYVMTKVKRGEIARVLGNNGVLNIKDSTGNVLATVNKDFIEQSDGEYIELNYNFQRNVLLQINNVENEGRLEFIHDRVLKEEVYARDQIKGFEQIKTQGILQSDLNVENKSLEAITQLKEPESFATISSSTNTLSTIQTNNNVEFNVILKTDDIKYDLYKNPSVEIEFPKEVTGVNAKLNPVFIDEFDVQVANVYENESGNKVIRLELVGEQSAHSDSISEGIILNVNANIDVDKTITSREAELILRYTNDNAGPNVYERKMPIRLQSKDGLLIYNNVQGFNADGEVLETIDAETLQGIVHANDIQRNLLGRVVLANNYEQDLSNVIVVGKNLEGANLVLDLLNTVEVKGANARVLYSNNGIDWNEDINSIDGVSAYKIEIESIPMNSIVSINYNFNIPENVGFNKLAELVQELNYVYNGQNVNNVFNVQLKTESQSLEATYNNSEISLKDEKVEDVTGRLEVTTKTTLGDKQLTENDSVYEGGTLKNVVTVSNKTGKDLNNVRIKVDQENAVIYDLVAHEAVNPVISNQKTIIHKYEEWDTGIKEFGIIENLKSGEVVDLTYQTVIKEVEGNDKLTFGEITIDADGIQTVNSNTIKNVIEQSEVKIITKYAYEEEIQFYPKDELPTELYLSNIKGEDLENVSVQLKFSDGLYNERGNRILAYYSNVDEEGNSKWDSVEEGKITNLDYDKYKNIYSFKISKLLANDNLVFTIAPSISEIPLNEDGREVSISTIVSVNSGKQYVSNIANRNIKQNAKDITVEQSNDSNKRVLKHNDTFNIEIEIKNNTDKDEEVLISDQISDVFTVNMITKVDGNTKTDITNEYLDTQFTFTEKLKANSSIKIVINVTVDATMVVLGEDISNDVTLTYDTDKITNKMEFDVKAASDVDDKEDDSIYVDPDDPDDPDNPDNPSNPDDSNNPNNPNNPDDSSNSDNKKFEISGVAWLDENKNGKRESAEKTLSNIEVILINEETGEFVKDSSGNMIKQITNSNGEYKFSVETGSYIVIFLYDSEEYNITEYRKNGVNDSSNSDAITKTVSINGQDRIAGITDKIQISNENVNYIDIGLIKKEIFDMKLDKFISKIVVQNAQGAKTYQYDNQQLAKVEIKSKYYKGSTVVVEYTIRVTNEGEIAGYANEIIDYLPSGFKFSSELNKDWYVGSDNNLHSISLGNEKIAAGETKNLTVILTKTLQQNEGGLVTNTAEIYKSSNEHNIADTDSIAGNKANGEDDISTASVIISVSTGAIKICLTVLLIMLIIIAIILFIIKKKGGRVDWKRLKVEF